MPDDTKLNDDDKTPKKSGEFRVPPRTWIVWIVIFAVIILLMLMRDRWQTEAENLPQWKFQQLADSNLIAQAAVNYSPQNPLLTEIIGKYYQADKDGNARHWILELQFVDRVNNIGAFFEQLIN